MAEIKKRLIRALHSTLHPNYGQTNWQNEDGHALNALVPQPLDYALYII